MTCNPCNQPYRFLRRAEHFAISLAQLLTTQCLQETERLSADGFVVPAPEVLALAAENFSGTVAGVGSAESVAGSDADLLARLILIAATWEWFTDSVDMDWSDAFQGFLQDNTAFLRDLLSLAAEARSLNYPSVLAAMASSRQTEEDEGARL